MQTQSHKIDTHSMLSEVEFQKQLETLSVASHALLQAGLSIGKTCNHPDMTVLQQACGFLEVAAHNGRVFVQMKAQEGSQLVADQIVIPKPPVQ